MNLCGSCKREIETQTSATDIPRVLDFGTWLKEVLLYCSILLRTTHVAIVWKDCLLVTWQALGSDQTLNWDSLATDKWWQMCISPSFTQEGPEGTLMYLGIVAWTCRAKVKEVHEIEESEDNANFLLMLDVIPAFVIIINSAVAGISADFEPTSFAWTVLETLFALFFIGEILVKVKVFGLKGYFMGADWYWSWFDLLCVILALIEMAITYHSLAAGQNAEMGAMSSLKMLKLARLGRIIRLLKFKIFQELKLMIQGVFTGLRVLFWAVVLLFGMVYLLGVVSRTLFNEEPEFRTVPRAMFTSFRCFTDGCSTYEGAPLQDPFLRFLFIIIHIFSFNLVSISLERNCWRKLEVLLAVLPRDV